MGRRPSPAMGRRPSSTHGAAVPPPQLPAGVPSPLVHAGMAPSQGRAGLPPLQAHAGVLPPQGPAGVLPPQVPAGVPPPGHGAPPQPSKSRRSALNAALGTIAGARQSPWKQNGRSPNVESVQHSTATRDDSSWVLPEYSTIPSQDNYYTNLLNDDIVEVLGSEDNVESDNDFSRSPVVADMSSQTKGKGRSKNFSEEEDMLLISAYLNISKDPIAGRDQKDGRFWERIEKYYCDNRNFESDRNWSSLRHRWTTVSKEVSLFNSYYEAIERKNESGKTINDKIDEAKADYQRLRKKAFSLMYAWNVLRHEPKWATIQDDGGVDIVAQNVARPPGRKAEKEKVRGRKREEDENDPFIEEVKKMRESRLETERDRRVREDQFLELEKTKIELERDQHHKKIMDTDTSAMDNESKRYYKLMKEEILARRFGSRQQ